MEGGGRGVYEGKWEKMGNRIGIDVGKELQVVDALGKMAVLEDRNM